MNRWVIAYDVSDDRSRTQLSRSLARHGVRRQQSVFECDLDAVEMERVVAEASALLVPGHDRLEVVAQCGPCRELRRSLGPRSETLEAHLFLV